MIRFDSHHAWIEDGHEFNLVVPYKCEVFAGASESYRLFSPNFKFAVYRMVEGVTYTVFRANARWSLPLRQQRITCVMIDPEGRAWIGEPTKWRLLTHKTPVETGPTVWTRIGEWLEDS